MRKVLFSLGTILMCVLLASCGKPMDKLQSMVDDLTENGKDWDADQWETFIRDVTDQELAFWESEPTKEEIKEFDKLGKSFKKAINKVTKNKKAEKAFEKAIKALDKDDDFEELNKRMNKAEKKARKAASKNNKDDDEDDSDEDEDEDDDY